MMYFILFLIVFISTLNEPEMLSFFTSPSRYLMEIDMQVKWT